jgi:hypothetical protein
MKLTIPPASCFANEMVRTEDGQEVKRDEAAIAFIETVVRPEIEDMVAHPEKYTCRGYSSWKVPFCREGAGSFVARVRSLLAPLGYEVSQSHDGGGLYATVLIRWVPELVDAAEPVTDAKEALEHPETVRLSASTKALGSLVGAIIALVAASRTDYVDAAMILARRMVSRRTGEGRDEGMLLVRSLAARPRLCVRVQRNPQFAAMAEILREEKAKFDAESVATTG